MKIQKYRRSLSRDVEHIFKLRLKITSKTLAALVLLAGLLPQAQAQTYSFSPAWSAPNGIAHIANGNNNRGVAYDSVFNQVFIATRNGSSSAIDVFNGTSGTLLSGAGGIAGATSLAIDQVGVSDDGVLYGAPLTTSVSTTAGSVTVYAWTNWSNNSSPRTAYASASGDPVVANFPTKRIGDTMAVSGSGLNTLILMGVAAQGTNFVLLHTSDGINFTPTVVLVPTGLPNTSGSIFGIAFYTNNTFLVVPGPNQSGASQNVFLVQYPSNFASQSAVTGTVLGSAATLNYSSGRTMHVTYSPGGKMLGVIQAGNTTPNTNAIFSMANYTASVSLLASTNFSTPNANVNNTGMAAFGGAGKTNFFYVLESNNGLQAYAINFIATPIAPTILASPAGVTGAFPTYGLTVTANGTAPLKYQWLASNAGTNISATFTNIPGAITNSFAITTSSTNYYEVIITNSVGSVTSAPVLVSLLKPTTSTVVTQNWSIAPGATGYNYLTTGDDNRGLAYDVNSNRVVVASRSPGLYILDGTTGTNIGTLSMSGVTGGTFALDQVGIADDDAVYAGNLVLAGGAGFTLYRWAGPITNAAGTIAFQDTSGVLGAVDRWGDTMAVRGSGANTQVILGSRAGTNIALLTTSDGINFNGQVIGISNAPAGFAGLGIAFGAGNTIYAKNNLSHLYVIGIDPVNNVGGVLLDYPNPAKTPTYMTAISADLANNILAGLDLGDNPHDLKLFQLTGTSDAEHMRQDLASLDLELPPDAVRAIESLAG